jgi:hypothetical protein
LFVSIKAVLCKEAAFFVDETVAGKAIRREVLKIYFSFSLRLPSLPAKNVF